MPTNCLAPGRHSSSLPRYLLLLLLILSNVVASAQTQPISGIITDEEGHPLAGASISLKNKPIGTSTQADGSFHLKAEPSDILIISYAGYVTENLKIDTQTEVHLALKQGNKKMDELVVVGYGRQSRQTLTGAVSSLDPQVLKSAPNTNVGTALEGTVT